MVEVSCPDCGYLYPPGSVVLQGHVVDPVVESGGRSLHPPTCRRSEAIGSGSSLGVFQHLPATFGKPC